MNNIGDGRNFPWLGNHASLQLLRLIGFARTRSNRLPGRKVG
jgi:hypothetical protein